VIFDLDDTLIAERSVDAQTLEEVSAEAGERFGFDATDLVGRVIEIAESSLPYDGHTTRGAPDLSWAEGLWGPFDQGDRGCLGITGTAIDAFREQVWAAVASTVSTVPEAGHWCAAEFARRRAATQRLLGDPEPVLRSLRERSVRLGLLTNGTVCVQEAKLSACGLAEYFDAVLISGALAWPKPDPRAFEATMEGLGSAPENTLMVGNSRFHDIDPALSLGMPAAWLVAEPAGADGDPLAITRLHEILARF
jgi:putative hydrolase of the HAD superfamily